MNPVSTHASNFLLAPDTLCRARQQGFTLIEVMITLAIATILCVTTLSSLLHVNAADALRTEKEKILSLIVDGRSRTISARNASVYGIHFEERKVVLFKGTSYNAGAAGNEVQSLHDAVKVSAITLSGGGSEVLFKKLSGGTTQIGTIRLSSISDANASTTITISGTGTAYSQ